MSTLELNNLTESLKYIIDISRELATITGNDDQLIPAYWVRTCNAFSQAITSKLVSEYNNNTHPNNKDFPSKVTPHELRFPGIKAKFLEIYETFQDELSEPFLIQTETGTKKVNDSWLRISEEISEDEFDHEDENFVLAIKENRGIKVSIKTVTTEEKKRNKVDIELPLSSLYRAALYVVKNKKIKKPIYTYAILYGIYNCFKYSVPPEKINPQIQSVISDIYDRRESLLEREKGKISSTMESVKQSIAPLIDSNRGAFETIMGQIDNGLDSLSEDKIEEVAEQCHKAIEMFTSNQKKSLDEVIGGMISTDSSKVRETMDRVGLHEENIRAIVDTASGAVSNSDLKASIPTIDEIDAIVNGV